MVSRWFQLAILVCWLGAVSWLIVVKVAPLYLPGDRPDLMPVGEIAEGPLAKPCWAITWKDQKLGHSTTTAEQLSDGIVRVRSIVRFDDLPVDDLVESVFGPLGSLLRPLPSEQATLASRTTLTHEGQLRQFETRLRMGKHSELIVIRGSVANSKLSVTVSLHVEDDLSGMIHISEIARQEFDFDSSSMYTDSFSPPQRMANLRVGQAWTFHVFQPLVPNQPLRVVLAKVERREPIVHQGETINAYVVSYHDNAGTGLSASHEPLAQVWVGRDGNVVRQDVRLGGSWFRFDRLDRSDPAGRFDYTLFSRLFQGNRALGPTN